MPRRYSRDAVREYGADFGIGLGWRLRPLFPVLTMPVAEFIEGYYLVGLLAETLLLHVQPGAKIIHDPRLTWNTIERGAKAVGGVAGVEPRPAMLSSRNGCGKRMRLYGGEMSAHHYFRKFAYCDSGMIPVVTDRRAPV
jgi:phosphomannomutase